MPKVLLISQTQIYPLYSGGALAQYYFIDGLKDEVEFVLCTVARSKKYIEILDSLQKKQPKLKIYYANEIIEVNAKSKWKSRVLNLLSCLFRVIFNYKSEKEVTEADDFLDPYFLHVDHAFTPQFVQLVNDVIIKENIDIVQFDFYDTIDLCFAVPKNIKKVFIHHELRYKRLKLASNDSKVNEIFKDYLIKKTEWFETLCFKEMDVIGVFNEDDANLLRADFDNVVITPFGIPSELIINREVSLSFNRLLFLGSEGHTPNKLGLIWFLDKIYIPNINKINFQLNIIGDWSETFKAKYSAYNEIVFLGVVYKLNEYYEQSILVNPILTGGGLRTKLLQAFVNKVPVLSTKFGAEGCFSKNETEHLGFFENKEEFESLFVTIDFNLLTTNGFEYYQKRFGDKELLKIRTSIYK